MLLQRTSPMPCWSVRCVQIQHYCSYSIQRNNRIHWLQSCPGKAAAGGCPSAPASGARPRPVTAPARCAGAAPTSRCWSAQGSPKHASMPDGDDQSSRRPWRSKSEIPPEFESKPEVLVGELVDQSKRGSPKREWMPKVRVKAWSARRSRNLGCRRYCRL